MAPTSLNFQLCDSVEEALKDCKKGATVAVGYDIRDKLIGAPLDIHLVVLDFRESRRISSSMFAREMILRI